MIRWKIYKASKLATFVSIIGALCVYGGILCLFASAFLGAVICIAIGCGFHFLAEKIASNAAFKAWKKQIVSNGYEQRIVAGDLALAAQLYQGNPGEKTLQYFETLNPYVASRLRNTGKNGSAQQAVPAGNQGARSGPKPVQAAPKSEQAAAKPVQMPVKPAAPDMPVAQPTNSSPACRCAACGANLAAGSRFCFNCGSKFEQVRKCPRCGNRLIDGAKFCRDCGYQI